MAHFDFNTARAQSVPHSPERFSFLDLPGEIRNRIYELIYMHKDPVRIAETNSDSGPVVLRRRVGDINHGLVMLPNQPHLRYFPAGTWILNIMSEFAFQDVDISIRAIPRSERCVVPGRANYLRTLRSPPRISARPCPSTSLPPSASGSSVHTLFE